ncbi:MAG: divalent-cation tolerance protein CutA [Chromatiales bacterium]|nr:divalent-cation tolerance protein CutA [Chromatiales bacterium]
MDEEFLLVLTTCPDPESARRLTTKAVEAKLAACVNQLPGVNSFYSWEGKLQQTVEIMLLFKTRRPAYEALEALLQVEHPYELPEIIAVPINHGSPGYLKWIEDNTT